MMTAPIAPAKSARRRRFYRMTTGRTYHRDRSCSYFDRTAPRRVKEFLAPDPGVGSDLVVDGVTLNDCPRCGV